MVGESINLHVLHGITCLSDTWKTLEVGAVANICWDEQFFSLISFKFRCVKSMIITLVGRHLLSGLFLLGEYNAMWKAFVWNFWNSILQGGKNRMSAKESSLWIHSKGSRSWDLVLLRSCNSCAAESERFRGMRGVSFLTLLASPALNWD